RLHDIVDARFEIRDAQTADPDLITASISRRDRRPWLLVAGLAVVAIALAIGFASSRSPQIDLTVYHSTILWPDVGKAGAAEARRYQPNLGVVLAVSPDGRRVALVAAGADGRPMLWVRPLNA